MPAGDATAELRARLDPEFGDGEALSAAIAGALLDLPMPDRDRHAAAIFGVETEIEGAYVYLCKVANHAR